MIILKFPKKIRKNRPIIPKIIFKIKVKKNISIPNIYMINKYFNYFNIVYKYIYIILINSMFNFF